MIVTVPRRSDFVRRPNSASGQVLSQPLCPECLLYGRPRLDPLGIDGQPGHARAAICRKASPGSGYIFLCQDTGGISWSDTGRRSLVRYQDIRPLATNEARALTPRRHACPNVKRKDAGHHPALISVLSYTRGHQRLMASCSAELHTEVLSRRSSSKPDF